MQTLCDMNIDSNSKCQGNGSQHPGEGIGAIVLEIVKHCNSVNTDPVETDPVEPRPVGLPDCRVTNTGSPDLCGIGILSDYFRDSKRIEGSSPISR